MKVISSITLTLALALLCSSAFAREHEEKVITLTNANGARIGTATLRQQSHGVAVHLALTNLTPGVHAIHFHQTASCEPPDFKSAGGHFNPTGAHHGLKNPQGPHAGDMENITVASDGTARVTLVNPRVTLDPGKPNSLLANGGTSLVIHAQPDDMKTDPAGNSGARIACGVIVP